VEAAEHVGARRSGERSDFEDSWNGLRAQGEPNSGEEQQGRNGQNQRAKKLELGRWIEVRRGLRRRRSAIGEAKLRGNGLGFDALDRYEEAIAATRKSFNVVGMFGGIGESLAQLVDGFVEAILEVDESLGGPETLPDFFASDNYAGVLEKHEENLERLTGEA
jgi:hypothetical protein